MVLASKQGAAPLAPFIMRSQVCLDRDMVDAFSEARLTHYRSFRSIEALNMEAK